MTRGGIAGWGIVAAVTAAVALTPATALAADRDKDGLPNKWEEKGAPGGLNLKRLGARPKHKDVFVQLNYSKQTGPRDVTCNGLDALVAAFRKAPLSNPDHRNGIKLHIDADKTCGGSKRYDLGGSKTFKIDRGEPNPDGCATLSDRPSLARNRYGVFHSGNVVANSELCSAEGQASEDDFLIKENGGGSFFGYVFLHEMGHVFSLDHGPFNGFSVMSGGAYGFGDNSGVSVIDFTRFPIQALNETNLNENTGYTTGSDAGDEYMHDLYGPQFCLGDHDQNPGTPDTQAMYLVGRAGGPIDFDCDGADFWVPPYSQYIDPNPSSYDINGDGVVGTVPAVPAEWPTVRRHLGDGRIGEKSPLLRS